MFLNPERVSMPDIDIDFCYERRQEVIDYVIRKYGAECVSQIITFGTLSAKATAIATFSLCGFANISSIAILIGGIGGMAPSRKGDIARLGWKAIIAGTLANLLSATIAGFLLTM